MPKNVDFRVFPVFSLQFSICVKELVKPPFLVFRVPFTSIMDGSAFRIRRQLSIL